MWSFGHLAVLCFIIGFVVYFMVENRVRRLFDEEKKKRAGGNENEVSDSRRDAAGCDLPSGSGRAYDY